MAIVYFVVPCYNEEAVLPETTRQLTEKITGSITNGADYVLLPVVSSCFLPPYFS